MGIFRRRVPNHYIPVHPDNVAKDDWIIVLEGGHDCWPFTGQAEGGKGHPGEEHCKEI